MKTKLFSLFVLFLIASCGQNKNETNTQSSDNTFDNSTAQSATKALFACLTNNDTTSLNRLIAPYEIFQTTDNAEDHEKSYQRYVKNAKACFNEIIENKVRKGLDFSKAYNFLDKGEKGHGLTEDWGMHYNFNVDNRFLDLEGVLIKISGSWYIGEGFKIDELD